MKALTGLPPSAYLKTTEEAKIPLVVLERLVHELEAGATPAYISHYRQDISGGLDELRIRFIEERLQQFLELEERRITVLTSAGQQDRLTPELRMEIESATDRWELEDLYLPFKPKRESPATVARKQGLEELASRLDAQQSEDRDINALAAGYLKPDAGITTPAEALRGAREIIAQSWSEDTAVRRGLRPILRQSARIVVHGDSPAGAVKGKYKNLLGYQARLGKVAWRQMMALRRAVQEIGLRYEIALPENRVVSYLIDTKITTDSPELKLQLGAVAARALEAYLAPAFAKELLQVLNERCDREAVESFQKNLRKVLMTPPAGHIGVVGLETGRPGGWRAAVINSQGEFVEGAIVHREGGLPDNSANGKPVASEPESKTEEGADVAAAEAASSEDVPVSVAEETPPATETQSDSEPAEQEAQPAGAVAQPGVEAQSAEPDGGQPDSAAPDNTEAESPETVAAEPAAAEPETIETISTSDEVSSEEAPQPEAVESAAASEAPAAEVPESPSAKAPAAEDPAAESRPGKPLPKANKNSSRESMTPLADLLRRHEVGAIVMAGSPGIRQVERLVRGAIREAGRKDVFWTTVNEAGSWIYATSKTARRDMPNTSLAQRSAACLAKRLQDPLAAVAHLDQRTLGLGQFHQSVDPRKLREGLRSTLESTVHAVGIDLNTAPLDLLALAPGMTERLAKRVVEHRRKNGPFTKREQLGSVSGLSKRIYKQAVGFTRVYGGEIPLDATGIHPEQYLVAEKILAAAGISAAEALDKAEALDAVSLEELQSLEFPLDVLKGIVRQLKPSVRKPRGEFIRPVQEVELRTAEELTGGKKIEGVVTNVAAFGAFVDIGADQDGLVHISRMSDKFVKDPKVAVKVGDRVEVYVVAVDEGCKRISLSMRDPAAAAAQRPGRTRVDARKSADGQPRRRKEPRRETKAIRRSFGPTDKERLREEQDIKKLSLDEKLALLQSKYRTKV